MTLNEFIYCLSIVFQVTGSILLLTYFLGDTRDRVIHTYFPGTNIAPRDKDNNIKLEKSKVHFSVVTIYKNRAAFVLLAVGYFGGIFGENTGDNKCIIALTAAVLTALLLWIVEKISIYLAKKNYPDDLTIPYGDVEDYVDTTITNAEIDELFNK